jgi:hypothetical protein
MISKYYTNLHTTTASAYALPHQINEETPITLSHQKYDELGRLRRKYLHGGSGNALQTINYAYNFRSDVSGLQPMQKEKH